MEPRLQKRVQRYGWDLAAAGYEPLWQAQLAGARAGLLARAALTPGERVLDVACGTGLISFEAARAVAPDGVVVGVDLSERMVDASRRRARLRQAANATFIRMDAEQLSFPDGGFDVALCGLGLMYAPEPGQVLREMRRVLKPGGRMISAVWGEPARCGWAGLFEIVDAEVESDVCPLFFRLGQHDTLARQCAEAGFCEVEVGRVNATLDYCDGNEACDAAFVGGPVALAWSRFDAGTQTRVRARYLESIEPWRRGRRYAVPAEFVIVAAAVPPEWAS